MLELLGPVGWMTCTREAAFPNSVLRAFCNSVSSCAAGMFATLISIHSGSAGATFSFEPNLSPNRARIVWNSGDNNSFGMGRRTAGGVGPAPADAIFG